MITFLATGGLLLLALVVASCLWPPRASSTATLVLSLGVILVVTILALSIAFVIIIATIGGAILIGAGLPIPEWPMAAVERAKTQLLRSFRHGA
jgi:hypothetical protein